MAAILVQSKTGTSTSATTTAAFDALPTPGNLIVISFSADDYNGSPNAGWTQSAEMEQQTYHGSYLWWKVAADTSNSFQYTIGSATHSSWVLQEWSGLDASPYDDSQGQFAQSSDDVYTSASITPSTGDRLLIAAFGGSSSAFALNGAYASWLNSFTAIGSTGKASSPATCNGAAYRIVTGDGSTAYSTGATYPNTVQSRSALIIAFKIASAPTGYDITADTGTYAVTGTASTLKTGRVVAAAAGAYAITGATAALVVAKKVAALAGSYAIAGTAALGIYTRRMAAAAGSYAVSGSNAALVAGLGLSAAAGSYVVTGSDVALTTANSPVMSAGTGAYAITGSDAAFIKSTTMTGASGSYTLTGTAASMVYAREVATESGAYTITGQDAALLTGIKMTASAGAYAVTGSTVDLIYFHGLVAEPGSYALDGADAALVAASKVSANGGTYVLTGTAATFARYSHLTIEAAGGTYEISGQPVTLTRTYLAEGAAGAYQITGKAASIRHLAVGQSYNALARTVLATREDRTVYADAEFSRTILAEPENRVIRPPFENRTRRA